MFKYSKKDMHLPLEYPFRKAVSIYIKRLLVFFAVVIVNYVVFALVILFIKNYILLTLLLYFIFALILLIVRYIILSYRDGDVNQGIWLTVKRFLLLNEMSIFVITAIAQIILLLLLSRSVSQIEGSVRSHVQTIREKHDRAVVMSFGTGGEVILLTESPSTASRAVAVVTEGEEVKLLSECDKSREEWCLVQYGDKSGWIQSRLLADL